MQFMAKTKLAAKVTAGILLLTGVGTAARPAAGQSAADPGGVVPAANAQPKSDAPKPAAERAMKVQISDLLWNTKTDVAGHAKALRTLGRNGFAILRNPAEEKVFLDRLEEANIKRRDYQVRAGPSFAKGVKVVCWRDIMQADILSIAGAEQTPAGLRLMLETKRMPADENWHSWQAICGWIPRADRLEVPGPGNAKINDEIWTADATWGDVADGLQASLEVKQTTIQPGDDISLTMTLRNLNPAATGKPILVWDNKYSNGYRADFYLVVTPDGHSRILRRPDQIEWRKNIPTPITIPPAKSWTLAGTTDDVIVKSLKDLGLDTTQKGIYTLTGYYAGDEPEGTKVDPARQFWTGQIATASIQIRVGDGEFKPPTPETIKPAGVR